MATTKSFVRDFTDAEVRILDAIVALLQNKADHPEWAQRALANRPELRRAVSAILHQLSTSMNDSLAAAGAAEALRASRRAQAVTRRLAKIAPRPSNALRPTVIAPPLRKAMLVHDIMPTVLRSADDIYCKAVAQVMVQPITTEKARLEAVSQALGFLTRNGVTSFVDKAGRRWNLTSYLEMATRHALHRASSDWYANALTSEGVDLVCVSHHTDCSPQCLPFQGQILSLTGLSRGVVGMDSSGRPRKVVASLLEARTLGYEHPGCRHVLKPWIPGDDLPTPEPVDPQVYADEQRLRALERRVRSARYAAAAKADPQGRADANAQVRRAQKAIREHVAATGRRRQPHRERATSPR